MVTFFIIKSDNNLSPIFSKCSVVQNWMLYCKIRYFDRKVDVWCKLIYIDIFSITHYAFYIYTVNILSSGNLLHNVSVKNM